ncbi:MAG: NAD(+)/NADH kinase [Thermodesulfobacteriota bacterium]|nr:NAD(+)/NADH kinase [Thermodesulfobacteriota bacterium]
MKQSIGIVVKKDKKARQKGEELKNWLIEKGVKVVFADNFDYPLPPSKLFCIIVLGGDGTFLSAARLTGSRDIPLMGIKFGEVGFLAETTENDLFRAVDALLAGNFVIEERMRLNVSVIRKEKEIASVDVLNDVVINKSALSRLAYSAVYINSNYLTTFKADGLIVGTPTGSTAYSLAAGGPVIHPAVPGIILTPICPFTLTNRPLIISDSSEVEIRLEGDPTDIVLTFDGQEGMDIDSRDRIIVKKSANSVKMISFSDQNYFNVLKARLMWSGGRG